MITYLSIYVYPYLYLHTGLRLVLPTQLLGFWVVSCHLLLLKILSPEICVLSISLSLSVRELCDAQSYAAATALLIHCLKKYDYRPRSTFLMNSFPWFAYFQPKWNMSIWTLLVKSTGTSTKPSASLSICLWGSFSLQSVSFSSHPILVWVPRVKVVLSVFLCAAPAYQLDF